MPTFASDTVHGLSADVYFGGTAVRVFGDITLAVTPEVLDLTANDEGNFNPVDVLRRGESVTVGVPVSDTQGLATLSGVLFAFADTDDDNIASGLEAMVLPKSTPGDSYLAQAQELRLVTRDGAATWVFPSAVVVGLEDLSMSEESQQAWGATFRCFTTTISGVDTPFYVLSGSHVTTPV
jgi:hypothetical protein